MNECIVCGGQLGSDDSDEFQAHVFCSLQCSDAWDVETALDPPQVIDVEGHTAAAVINFPVPDPLMPTMGVQVVHVLEGMRCVVCQDNKVQSAAIWMCEACEVEAVLGDQ